MNTTIPTAETSTEIPFLPLSDADRAHLIENKGTFENGYDGDGVAAVLREFESARLVCVWGSYDDMGYGGDSEFFGQAKFADVPGNGVTSGPWRQVHPDVWTYLSDPDSTIDPATIACLLAPTAEFARQDIDTLFSDGECNMAVKEETETCTVDDCDESLDDGEGFDGYCGNHADKIEGHNHGAHRPLGETDDEGDETTGPDDECPNCDGANITWG